MQCSYVLCAGALQGAALPPPAQRRTHRSAVKEQPR